MIDETLLCIHAEGFGAASARHIARKAGVTWGVIQYHFGDRDGLLLSVVDYVFAELIETLNGIRTESATVTLRQRITFGVDAAWRALSSGNSLAALEIVVATRASGGSTASTHLAELHNAFGALGRRLGGQLATRHGRDIGNLMWATLRGLVIAQLTAAEPLDTSRERKALVEAIVFYIDSRKPSEHAAGAHSVGTHAADNPRSD
ncbi:TetR/AcrR family transcriptional regulator [Mycobacterium sp. DL440]|uniref:TetR/AcrR family transcriptional regulator n=1 Tax=Mycobacterium sp. DL440 TaxID=2675523 RepID=UPI001FBA500F|nr:TetR/AcrR family transcriptional regulator [Mycobacterium sp. DL440]